MVETAAAVLILMACLVICAFLAGQSHERIRVLRILKKMYGQVCDDYGGMAVAAMIFILGEILKQVEGDHNPVPGS